MCIINFVVLCAFLHFYTCSHAQKQLSLGPMNVMMKKIIIILERLLQKILILQIVRVILYFV